MTDLSYILEVGDSPPVRRKCSLEFLKTLVLLLALFLSYNSDFPFYLQKSHKSMHNDDTAISLSLKSVDLDLLRQRGSCMQRKSICNRFKNSVTCYRFYFKSKTKRVLCYFPTYMIRKLHLVTIQIKFAFWICNQLPRIFAVYLVPLTCRKHFLDGWV